jgi:RHS repeat-associated protein
LDYFGARYYASAQGRFTSADPILLAPSRVVNPQLINLYAYAANNPFAYLDPSGEENIRLGADSERAIKEELKKAKAALKESSEDATLKAQVKSLETRLQAVQQGNKVVGAWLDQMKSRGQDNGMQLSDFTLSTDPANDLAQATRDANPGLSASQKKDQEEIIALQNWSGNNPDVGATIGGKIYILSTSRQFIATANGGAYTEKAGNIGIGDLATAGGTFLRHEQDHKNGIRSEYRAYSNQLLLLDSINASKKPFANQKYFQQLRQGIQYHANEAKKREGIK